MAVTRSTSAKKVVSKAVAVKVTNSSGGKYVSWDDRYNQLFALSEKEGHCRPHSSTTLGERCNQQRSNYNDNNRVLYQYQIDKLIEIDFQFNLPRGIPMQQRAWNDRYNDLVDYKNDHGHASPHVSEGQLGRWCKDQRHKLQNKIPVNATMYQYRIDKLAEIDFQFSPPMGRRTLQRANLPARPDLPDLPAWPDMPALPDMPTLPAWLDMPALPEMLPDCVPPLPNVIAV